MKLGVLDIGHPREATLLAPRVDELGYSRYWLGEHHGHPNQSGSPEVLTAVIAGMTRRLRVGPAGVLLRFYSTYKVAQTTRVLESVFPGRIDLGAARSIGCSEDIADLLMEGRKFTQELYEAKVIELAQLLGQIPPPQGPRPLFLEHDQPSAQYWVLGASVRSASMAARLGACFCFSEYFAQMIDPDVDGAAAIHTYRQEFQPLGGLKQPLCNVAIAGAAVDSTDRLPAIMPLAGPAPLVGDVTQWRARLKLACERYQVDELIVLDLCEHFPDRLRSYEILAEAAELTATH